MLACAQPQLYAQSVVTISPQQCVWRAGDNSAWAAPSLDESGWQPYTQWKLNPDEPRYWVRCHADLSPLRGLAHPAIQMSLDAAYQLFVNGEPIGGAGNLRSGNFSMNTIRSFPLPKTLLNSQPATFAVRITYRYAVGSLAVLFPALPLGIRAGNGQMLDALRAGAVLSGSSGYLENAVCYGVIGVLAIMLLGLWIYDRSRPELLLLSIVCMSLAVLRTNEFCAAAFVDYPAWISFSALFAGNLAMTLVMPPFFFALARRRVPVLFWIAIGIVALSWLPRSTELFLPPSQALRIAAVAYDWTSRVWLMFPVRVVLTLAPFVAFWPYGRISRRMRPLAALCMLWAAVDLLWFSLEMASGRAPAVSGIFLNWRGGLLEARGFTTECVIAALLGLLFREQRRVTQESALLAGEMHAAREVQRQLVPLRLPAVSGLRFDAAYVPAAEVGGDFYQVIPLPAGAAMVIIGDVSGKGLRAAMTGTAAIGGLRAYVAEGSTPAGLLARLNRDLAGAQDGGFVTCLSARIDPDGAVTIANAGHLPPYLNGEEIAIPSGLPLGIAATAEYSQTILQLAPGDTLTFLSDGVAEARNAQGQLFGFDRARAISTHSAGQIAKAAELFGQNDDITVVTVEFSGVTTPAAAAMA